MAEITSLENMGARYWYATVSKIAENFISSVMDEELLPEDLRIKGAELKVLMAGGPWKKVDVKLLPNLIAQVETRKPKEVSPPRLDTRTIKQRLIEEIQSIDSMYSEHMFKWCVESWASTQSRVIVWRDWIDDIGAFDEFGEARPIMKHLTAAEKTLKAEMVQLALTPDSRVKLTKAVEDSQSKMATA